MGKYIWMLALSASLAACTGKDADDKDATTGDDTDDETTDTTEADSVYDQLGGAAGVNAVLDKFLANVLADSEINWFFADADAAALKVALHDQICSATGGGCTYNGATMKAAHTGMAITDAQFGALVGDLVDALDELNVDYTADFSGTLPADILMTTLASMQGDIVEDAKGDTVYFNQLGGHAAVVAVVDEFLANVVADSRINSRFADTDAADLSGKLVDQICDATGGYCTYKGATMKAAHAGMCITEAEFGYLVEDLLTALDTLEVPYTAGSYDKEVGADNLILALAGMQGDIVEDCTPVPL